MNKKYECLYVLMAENLCLWASQALGYIWPYMYTHDLQS